MGLAVVSPIVVAEAVIRLLRLVTGNANIGSPIGLMFLNVWMTNSQVTSTGSVNANALFYFWQVLWEFEGEAFVVSAVAGWCALTATVFAWRDGKDVDRLKRVWLVITFILVSGTLFTLGEGFRKARYSGAFLMAASLAAAMLAARLLDMSPARWIGRHGRWMLAAGLAALWLFVRYPHLRDRVFMDTGFQTVWSEMASTGTQRFAFVGSPGVTSFWAFSQWNTLTEFFHVKPVLVRQLTEIEELSPPSEYALVGLGLESTPPELRGFQLVRTIRVRMPKYDGRPTQDWRPNAAVHVYRHR
jgi:hypothetical protein